MGAPAREWTRAFVLALAWLAFCIAAVGLFAVIHGHLSPPEATFPLGANLWLGPSILVAVVGVALLALGGSLPRRCRNVSGDSGRLAARQKSDGRPPTGSL